MLTDSRSKLVKILTFVNFYVKFSYEIMNSISEVGL